MHPRRAVLVLFLLFCAGSSTLSAALLDLLQIPVDLSIDADASYASSVTVSASASDAALLDIAASDAARPVVAVPQLMSVRAYAPPSTGAAGRADEGAAPEADDVVVELRFTQGTPEELTAWLEAVADELRNGWYCREAEPLPFDTGDGRRVGASGIPFLEPVVGRIRVGLVAHDVVRSYWRVAVPVTARVSWYLNVWLDPATVPVSFSHAGATDPSSTAFDFVQLPLGRPGERAAVGFIPNTRDAEAIVTVDPTDRVREIDEKNNTAVVALTEVPTPADDIFPDDVPAAVEVVYVAPSPFDGNLRRLVENGARRSAYLRGTPADVYAFAPYNQVLGGILNHAGIAGTVPAAAAHDLIVGVSVPADVADWPDLAAELLEFFRQQWYVEGAELLTSVPTADRSAAADSRQILPVNTLFHLGLRLVPENTEKLYWRFLTHVNRVTPYLGLLGEGGHSGLPVAVLFEFGAPEQPVSSALEVVTVPPDAREPVVCLVEVDEDVDELLGVVVVDPFDAVRETDEDNNDTGLHWERPAPPEPEDDLFPLGERLRSRIVECTASARSPVLQQLVRKAAIHVAAGVDGFQTVHVFPWHQGIAGVGRFFDVPADAEFDLAVVGLFEPGVPVDEVPGQWADAFLQQWYVADAFPAVPGEGWRQLAHAAHLYGPRQAAVVLLKLAETDVVREYWRVTVPVVRETHVGAPIPVDVDRPRLGWLDMVVDLFAGGRAASPGLARQDHVGRPEPVLTGVRFEAAFEDPAGAVADSIAWDHVWLAPNEHTVAVGFVEIGGAPLNGTVTVDAGNAVPEADEDNNHAAFDAPDDPGKPPVPGHFEGWYDLVDADGTRDDAAVLVVSGELSNPSERAIRLEFNTTCQLDFTLGNAYQWSQGQNFPQIVTRTVVAPGSAVSWSIAVPLAETGWSGEPTELTVFLSGTDYRHVLQFPPDPDAEALQDQPDPEPEDDFIVGPDGIDLKELLPHLQDAIDLLEFVKAPAEGNVDLGDPGWVYDALNGFQGEDYLILNAGDGQDEEQILRRLKVGLQTFRMRLQEGWNMVSFPIQPVEPVEELLTRIPAGAAWAWRNGVYRALKTVTVGEGIWVHSAEPVVLEYLGEPQPRLERILEPGWHMIGTVNARDLRSLDQLKSSQAWDGREYRPDPEVLSGQGRWVFVPEQTRLDIR